MREGAKVRYGEILAKIELIYQQSDHSDCVKSLQWRFRQHKGMACANCLVTKLVSLMCAVNCSTTDQTDFGTKEGEYLVWRFKRHWTGPMQVFENYGKHTGHIRCRQPIS